MYYYHWDHDCVHEELGTIVQVETTRKKNQIMSGDILKANFQVILTW